MLMTHTIHEAFEDTFINYLSDITGERPLLREGIETASQERLLCMASMKFSGPVDGDLTLITSFQLCVLLASKLMDVESGSPAAREGAFIAIRDTLKLICRKFLEDQDEPDKEIILNEPNNCQISFNTWRHFKLNGNARYYTILGNPVITLLHAPGR